MAPATKMVAEVMRQAVELVVGDIVGVVTMLVAVAILLGAVAGVIIALAILALNTRR